MVETLSMGPPLRVTVPAALSTTGPREMVPVITPVFVKLTGTESKVGLVVKLPGKLGERIAHPGP